MSHFVCEQCSSLCVDTASGYITGCEHYPPRAKYVDNPIDSLIPCQYVGEEYERKVADVFWLNELNE